MKQKPTLLKVSLAALAGFLLTASLAVVPGIVIVSRSDGPQQEIRALCFQIEMEYGTKGLEPQAIVQGLLWKSFCLSVLQFEIDCLPFLLIGACMGPLLLRSSPLLKSTGPFQPIRLSKLGRPIIGSSKSG